MAKDLLGNTITKRAVPCTGSVLGLIEGAYSELEALRDEVQEIVDNASEGLAQTQRIQTLGETADALYGADDVPDVPDAVATLRCTYTEDQRKSKSTSRASRCAEACTLLEAAVGELDDFISTAEDKLCDMTDEGEKEALEQSKYEVEELRDTVQELLDNAQGAEFPGMYG